MSLLWLPVNLLQIAFVSFWSAGCIAVAILASKVARSPRPGLWMARRVWAPVVLAAAGVVRLEVRGRERLDPSRTYFVVANHQSWLDIPVLFAVLPMPVLFVAKQELARIPFLKHYLQAMGMVFVNRADRRDSVRSVGEVSERLRAGWSVLSFPEGTRSVDGRLQRFHAATFAAALDAGMPVLPIALDGAARVMPRQGIRFRPGRIGVVCGEPIPTEGMSRADRAALAARAWQAVAAELARLRGLRTEDVVLEDPVPGMRTRMVAPPLPVEGCAVGEGDGG